MSDLQAQLYEAGKLCGQQQLVIDRLSACNQALTEALEQIQQWARAYPVDLFTPLTDDQLGEAAIVLGEVNIDIGALHAEWARRILDDITRIAHDALKEDTP